MIEWLWNGREVREIQDVRVGLDKMEVGGKGAERNGEENRKQDNRFSEIKFKNL